MAFSALIQCFCFTSCKDCPIPLQSKARAGGRDFQELPAPCHIPGTSRQPCRCRLGQPGCGSCSGATLPPPILQRRLPFQQRGDTSPLSISGDAEHDHAADTLSLARKPCSVQHSPRTSSTGADPHAATLQGFGFQLWQHAKPQAPMSATKHLSFIISILKYIALLVSAESTKALPMFN